MKAVSAKIHRKMNKYRIFIPVTTILTKSPQIKELKFLLISQIKVTPDFFHKTTPKGNL